MKANYKFIIAIAFLLLSTAAFSQNTINFYNNTDKDIYAAYAYYDYSNSCWTSVGWYKVAPYSEKGY